MNDILSRALKTFVQAFVPVLLADISMIRSGIVSYGWQNWEAWLLPVIIPAVSAGLSAVWNLIIKYAESKKELKENE